MDQIYVIMLLALVVLAILDITVGVSNDAVNFLNSALGSKAINFKTAMFVASLGTLCGALFSGGMMEIARSGIFVPSMFSFNDVMVIFLAVMISDILLLDLFNSLGLPTSTTVSIVFELLGSAVCVGLLKIYSTHGDFSAIGNYINTNKAAEIVSSILLSVLLSFVLGTIVQYISRLLFTFQINSRIKYIGAIFGGVAITCITFFILVKGLKGVGFIPKYVNVWIKEHQLLILGMSLIFWTIMSQIFVSLFRWNILKVIIIIGTFALALAFAGNDLVNFIGVPIAAIQSYGFFQASGASDPNTYMMNVLADNNIVAPFYYLLIVGVIMVVTLWTSKKARKVIQTEMSLARQSEGEEKFQPNLLSRVIVRGSIYLGKGVDVLVPQAIQVRLERRFIKQEEKKTKQERMEEPAFDMVRASVNLMVGSILISLGTSLKLPLSTTYVMFMVAMGTSFADRAWDRDSAVYRVAGVFKVIGGWFVTALAAFTSAFILAYLLYSFGGWAFAGLMILLFVLLIRSNRAYAKKEKEQQEDDLGSLRAEDVATMQEVLSESSTQIINVIAKTKSFSNGVIDDLVEERLEKLKFRKKCLKKLDKSVDGLKTSIYYFIKNLDESSVQASKFYVHTLGYLQDMVQSVDFIHEKSLLHVQNNHKKLKINQVNDLKYVDERIQDLLSQVEDILTNESYEKIDAILEHRNELNNKTDEFIKEQIERIRTTETSAKNSKLYFSILMETKDLVYAIMCLLEMYKEFNAYVKSNTTN